MYNRLDVIVCNIKKCSRQKAKYLILNSFVSVNKIIIKKVCFNINQNDIVEIKNENNEYVSRGGLKLAHVIDTFGLEINNAICMDVGASTGGFTDCLLQNNAKKVYCIDVGSSQLHSKLLNCNKIINIQNTNIKDLQMSHINEKVDIITVDLSFISIKNIILHIIQFLKINGFILMLIKPQFEVGKKYIKNGVVKNKTLHIKVLKDIFEFLKNNNLFVNNFTFSNIRGKKGNIEYFVLIQTFETKISKDLNILKTVDFVFSKDI